MHLSVPIHESIHILEQIVYEFEDFLLEVYELSNNKTGHHIVIHGYYGAGNFGDDIILLSIIKSLRNSDPNINITVLSRGVAPMPGNKNFQAVSRYNVKDVEMAIKKADLFICGGGGIFQDYSGFDMEDHFGARKKGLNFYSVPIEMAYLLNKPIMLYAIGAGPLFSPIYRRYLKTVLGWADLITVRDEESAALIETFGPKTKPIVTADPAVNYAVRLAVNNTGGNKKYVGICLRSWFLKEEQQTKLIKSFANTADYLIQQYGYHIILFPFNISKGDYNLLKAVHENMKKQKPVLIKEKMPVKETVGMIPQMDFVVGMRLHSLVVGAANNVPSIGIAYDGKVSHFMSLLKMEDYMLSIADTNFHNLKAKIDALIENQSEIKSRLKKSVDKLKEKEKKNASMAIKLIRRSKQ